MSDEWDDDEPLIEVTTSGHVPPEGHVPQVLTVRPMELIEANDFVAAHHRHHDKAQGHRFSIGAFDEYDRPHACAIVGRPVSGLDPRRIIEVVRMCSDGTPNACSLLYGAAARAAKAQGFEKIQTYIYTWENGASLKAAGYTYERDAYPSGRHRARGDGQSRDTTHVAVPKQLWSKALSIRAVSAAGFGHHRRK